MTIPYKSSYRLEIGEAKSLDCNSMVEEAGTLDIGPLSEPPVTKEPWQMTQADWLRYSERQTTAFGFEWTAGSIKSQARLHRNQVAAASNAGLPVPLEVLASYPDLVLAAQTEEA